MDFISGFTTISSFLIACILAIGLQLSFFSPISPDMLEFPAISSSLVPSNSKLQDAEKLGEGLLVKPEDVTIDEKGVLYTATRDGWIKRLHKNGSWENWQWINSDQLLGITTAAAGGIIVCDCEKGLLWFTEDGVTNLASHVNGVKIRFADDVIEASDGSVYFSVASTKFGFHDWYLDLLEAKPHGQLLRYDPALNETSVLLGDLYFANGVALSPSQDYLIVCETWKFRCLKYWLTEEKRGVKEVFIDNLPGGPDNINLAPDGTFWIALLELVPSRLQYLHGSKLLKKLVATFPRSMIQVHGVYEKATVANVGSDGKIIKILDDPTGKTMSFVTSALEFEGHLYLGSLNSDFIGKLPL
ncbi:protein STRICTOSIDINE SYNTHASE-LIKE 4-like [Coffea eugenioides]|uniref:protein STRICTOSIDINE SYNTHASE-LIKE 4-like n=1 Tax=Coffea eugenioides TaxID=49369 RepID=UPI000F613A49|nr:protein STRICTOSIDINE SYNTHASE-LIKE 4-like [Coffea eugenioides]